MQTIATIEDVLEELKELEAQRKVTLQQGASQKAINKFTETHLLPHDYIRLLQYSNGLSISSLHLRPLENLEHYVLVHLDGQEEEHELPFLYHFGNNRFGDMLFINLEQSSRAKNRKQRDIIYTNPELEETMFIAKSFTEFIRNVMKGLYEVNEKDASKNNHRYWQVSGFKGYDSYLEAQIQKVKK